MRAFFVILASSISLTAAQGAGDLCYIDDVIHPSSPFHDMANIFINLLGLLYRNMRVYYMVQQCFWYIIPWLLSWRPRLCRMLPEPGMWAE